MSSIKINKDKICLRVLPHKKSDVIRRGQFALDCLPIEKVKEFIRVLFNLGIEGSYTWFDRIDPNISLRREFDKDMDLDNFLPRLLQSRSFVRLQTGDPFSDQIRFMAEDRPKGDGVTHFAWFECDFTPENYKKLDDEFKKTFGFRLKDIC